MQLTEHYIRRVKFLVSIWEVSELASKMGVVPKTVRRWMKRHCTITKGNLELLKEVDKETKAGLKPDPDPEEIQPEPEQVESEFNDFQDADFKRFNNQSQSNELLVLLDGMPLVSSEIVAQSVNVHHKNIIQLVRKYAIDLNKFGQVEFKTRLNKSGSPTEYALLNESQSTLLLTFLKNTKIARKFKVRLVQEFFNMREFIQSGNSINPAIIADIELLKQQVGIISETQRQTAEVLKIIAERQTGYQSGYQSGYPGYPVEPLRAKATRDSIIYHYSQRTITAIAKRYNLKTNILTREFCRRGMIVRFGKTEYRLTLLYIEWGKLKTSTDGQYQYIVWYQDKMEALESIARGLANDQQPPLPADDGAA